VGRQPLGKYEQIYAHSLLKTFARLHLCQFRHKPSDLGTNYGFVLFFLKFGFIKRLAQWRI